MTWLRNLSLGKKFSLLVGLQVLVLLLGGLLVWIRFQQVQGVLSLVRSASRQVRLTASLANDMNSLRTSHVEMIAASHDEAYLQKRGKVNDSLSAKVANDLQAMSGEASWTSEGRRLMGEATGVLDGYLGKFPGVLEKAKAGSVDGDPALMEANVGEARAAREGLEKLQALVQGEVDGQTKRADSIAEQTQLLVCAGALLSIAVAVLIARAVLSQVAASVGHLHSAMDRMAAGDLTMEAKVDTTDELGQIGAALNRSVHGLRATLAAVKQVSEQVASGATELSATTGSISSGADEASASSERMAAAAVQLAATIHTVAGNVHAAEVKSSVALEKASEGVAAAGNTSMAMAEIQESVSKIVQAVQVVTEIANQTNLLSLNAAIEAAKAGELGKGFAVVAEEVRKLAERSGLAANEIGALAGRCTASIGRGSDTVRVSGDALSAIHAAITEVASRISQIGAASEEQASTGEDVGRQVHLAAEAAGHTAQATREQALTVVEVSRTAQELAKAAETLQSTVQQFKV